MIYCPNPHCPNRQNSSNREVCESCGTTLLIQGRYRLTQPLRDWEEGYHTEIFAVTDTKKPEVPKVLKLLRHHRQQYVEMLQREAEILQCLNHPAIPKVAWDGYFSIKIPHQATPLSCLVMERIPGENLESWLETHGKINQKTALNWLKQLIQILDVIHHQGFFHRDIKPSNIILKPDGQLALIDFGTARPMSETYIARIRGNLKVTGIISGGYTPPEQLNYRAVPQSDYYALGRTFVHLLTGIHPVDLPTEIKTGRLLWRNKAPQVSRYLANFIDELMAAIPEQRPQTAQEILPFLTSHKLLWRSVFRLLKSRLLKLAFVGLLIATLGLLVVYRLSYPLIGQHFLAQGANLQEQGEAQAAYKAYQIALRHNPKDARIYSNLGFLCQYNAEELADLDPNCALENYQEAIELDPNNPVIRYNLAGLYDESGQLEQAQLEYQRVKQSDSFLKLYAASNLARLQLLDGSSQDAIQLSQEAWEQTAQSQELKPENRQLLQAGLAKNLGWAYFMETKYPQAQTYLENAIALDPNRTEAYCLLAQVLEAQGNDNLALAQWRNCLQGDSDSAVEIKTLQTLAIQRLTAAGEINAQ